MTKIVGFFDGMDQNFHLKDQDHLEKIYLVTTLKDGSNSSKHLFYFLVSGEEIGI